MKKVFLIGMIFLISGCSLNNTFAANKNLSFEAEAKDTLNSLIDFYSKKDIDNFIALVNLDFSDSLGRSCVDLAAALKSDFKSFQNINLYITGIKQQIISSDDSKITIVAEWNRALTVSSTAQIWLSRGTTNFTFIKEGDSKIKLKQITGDLFFALSDFDGIITLSSGTFDGQAITVSHQIKEGKFIN